MTRPGKMQTRRATPKPGPSQRRPRSRPAASGAPLGRLSTASAGSGAAEYPSYYAIIRQIPRGCVLTYGDVARLAGRPTFARRVGYALAALKDPTVPWWRVVNARGAVSPRAGDLLGACELDQRARLLQEGIPLDEEGCLELPQYRWSGEPQARGRGRWT